MAGRYARFTLFYAVLTMFYNWVLLFAGAAYSGEARLAAEDELSQKLTYQAEGNADHWIVW